MLVLMISKYFTSAASGRMKSSACCKDTCKLCFPWRLSLSFCSLTNSSETCSLDCVRTAYNAKKSINSHSGSWSDLFCPIYYHYFQKSGTLILFVKKGNKMMLWINTTSSLLPGLCTRNKGKVNFKSPGREEEASDKHSFVQSPTFLLCLSMSWLCSWRARRVGNHRGFQEHPPDAFSCKASLSWCTTHNPRPQKCNTGLHEDEFSWSPTNAVPGREKEETWFRYRKEWIALRKSNLVLEHEVLFIFSGLIPTRCSQTVFKN